MPLNIKSEKADELARRLAERTGETITQAVIHAIEDRLAALDAQDTDERSEEDAALDEMIAKIKSLPVLDPRSDDELLDYDEIGAWR